MTPEKSFPSQLKTKHWSLESLRNVRLEYLLAGVSGGVTSTLLLHPLDLVKVRFQVNEGKGTTDRPQYRGIFHALRTVAKSDGFTGLYRGVTPNVWGAGTSWGLYFFIYNHIKMWMQGGDAQLPLTPGHHLSAASIAGITTLAFTNPIWVTKTRICLQYDSTTGHSGQYRGMLDTLRQIYVQEGVRGWYRGFVPGVFGVSHGALQFMTYDELKNRYNQYCQRPINTKLSTTEYITFAALSKMFAVAATYPYQVVRSRLQDQHRQYSGVADVLARTWRREGVAGFYKGITPNLLRVTPACCITFVVYETIMASFKPDAPPS